MIFEVSELFLSPYQVDEAEVNKLSDTVELLNSIADTASHLDYTLTLKKGYAVMLPCNLQPENGRVNGFRYILNLMARKVLFLRIATGIYKGKRLILPRIPCNPGDDDFLIPGFKRTQFFVRGCYAISPNKAQERLFNGAIVLDLKY